MSKINLTKLFKNLPIDEFFNLRVNDDDSILYEVSGHSKEDTIQWSTVNQMFKFLKANAFNEETIDIKGTPSVLAGSIIRKVILVSNLIDFDNHKGRANAIIVNSYLAYLLNSRFSLVSLYDNSNATNSKSSIYQAGIIGGLNIYVNKILPYKDNSLLIVRKDEGMLFEHSTNAIDYKWNATFKMDESLKTNIRVLNFNIEETKE